MIRNASTGLVLLLALMVASGVLGQPLVVFEEGDIEGAPFTLGLPEPWNGQVLLIAHGWRPPGSPLVAVLDPFDPVVTAYLDAGWMVAATGYRHNGWILEEAAEDLVELLGYIDEAHGRPSRVVVEGSSLGGNIGLLLAEAENPSVDGVLALGADPEAEGPDGPGAWTWAPRVPVIFFSNHDEYEPVEAYAARVGGGATKPALLVSMRSGHVNFSGPERLEAHAMLDRWLVDRVRPPGWVGRPYDATLLTEDPPSRAVPGPGWREGRITAVDPVYGNIETDLVAADLLALGLEPGEAFRVSCVAGARNIFWGTSYGDVNEGKLVGFVTADGYLRVAVNGGNAAKRLDGRVGEAILIETVTKENDDDPRRGNRTKDDRIQRDP